jgi:hypothetical protein
MGRGTYRWIWQKVWLATTWATVRILPPAMTTPEPLAVWMLRNVQGMLELIFKK